jgi:hypothetical protein
MNSHQLELFYDERLANFIAGALLFIFLNIFEELQERKHYCPLYCEAKHKHNLVLKKNDE